MYIKNIIIGKNNYISKKAIIHNNVIIGDNNKIYDNVILYPKTVIGNNNIILNNNIIGEIPIQSNGTFQHEDYSKTKGVKIGDNNFFHVRNLIFAGSERATEIKNNNKLLADCHLNHDSIIYNNVTLYPRITMGGYSKCLDYSNIGGNAFIQQRKIIGQYSMVGGSQLVAKNVFPYYVYINNKITRLNTLKLPEYIKNTEQQEIIFKIANYYYNNEKEMFNEINNKELNSNIKKDLLYFLQKINITKS